jgi:hypothetical protein
MALLQREIKTCPKGFLISLYARVEPENLNMNYKIKRENITGAFLEFDPGSGIVLNALISVDNEQDQESIFEIVKYIRELLIERYTTTVNDFKFSLSPFLLMR